MYKTRLEQPTWQDIIRNRHEYEDAPVRRFYAQYAKLGIGHLNKNVPIMERKVW